jgi:hypothetical protein
MINQHLLYKRRSNEVKECNQLPMSVIAAVSEQQEMVTDPEKEERECIQCVCIDR